jgi:hypothetical protein
MKISIKSRFDGRVLYECEAESMQEVLRNAVKVNANLRDANLRCANLFGADLSCADLFGANLLIYQTDIWNCYIQPDNIRIGCEYHSVTEWFAYDDERISKMESRALDWWKRHKAAIQAIHATLNAKGTG